MNNRALSSISPLAAIIGHSRVSAQSHSGVRPQVVPILAVALAARSFVLWLVMARFPRGWFYSHGLELGTLSQSLLSGHGLSSPFGGSTGPTALLAPGYPACIALLFRLFGPFTSGSAIAVMTVQLLCNLATVWIMMLIAQHCFGARVANLSGAFWAVSLPLLWMPTIFWETCVSTLLLVGMLGVALRLNRTSGLPLWGLTGASAALASLVNPALLLSLLSMLVWIACKARRSRRLVFAFFVFSAVFAPWPIRNARSLHAFIPLRSTIGLELWMGNREGATGFLDESVFPLFNREEYQLYVVSGEAAYMRNKRALAVAYIHAHPMVFVERCVVRFLRFWSGTGTQHGSVLFALHATLTSVLGWLGICRLLQARRFRLATLFLLPLLVFPVPYYLTHAEFRYRLVIDPLLTILGAYAILGAAGQSVVEQA